jgi:UDP-2,3-diacylglucosamine pyrophosphatase LpxH
MTKTKKRKVDIVVISDVHLGTYGCRANELNQYLKSIKPGILILNGDIIDIWQFKKRFFPASHLKVIKQILNMLVKGVQVYYITGNHDEMFRKFESFSLGSFKIVNQLTLTLNNKKTWFFHGDVFDIVIQNSKWLARIGSVSYDGLIIANTLVNFIMKKLGKKPVQLSKKIKDNVKTALKYIGDFELTAAQHASRKGIATVVCGHIHKPQMRTIETAKGEIEYLNSGDWIENLTALEYNRNKWRIFHFDYSDFPEMITLENSADDDDESLVELKNKDIFKLVSNQLYEN